MKIVFISKYLLTNKRILQNSVYLKLELNLSDFTSIFKFTIMKFIMRLKITNLILAYVMISIWMNTTFGMDQQSSMNTFAILGAANNISPIKINFNCNSGKHKQNT